MSDCCSNSRTYQEDSVSEIQSLLWLVVRSMKQLLWILNDLIKKDETYSDGKIILLNLMSDCCFNSHTNQQDSVSGIT